MQSPETRGEDLIAGVGGVVVRASNSITPPKFGEMLHWRIQKKRKQGWCPVFFPSLDPERDFPNSTTASKKEINT